MTERLSDLDTDITSAISRNVSLHDAMLTSPGVFGLASDRTEPRTTTQQQRAFFRMESIGSLNSDASPGMALGLAALPFASVCNITGNVSSNSALGGCLDEAVFDQINQLGLEGLDSIDSSLMDCLDSIDPRVLEDLESDSGLSLESSSGGPVSPGWFRLLSILGRVTCLNFCFMKLRNFQLNMLTQSLTPHFVQAHLRCHPHPVHTARMSVELQATAVRQTQSPLKALLTTPQHGHLLRVCGMITATHLPISLTSRQ